MISEGDLHGLSRQHCFTTPKGEIVKSISMREPKLSIAVNGLQNGQDEESMR